MTIEIEVMTIIAKVMTVAAIKLYDVRKVMTIGIKVMTFAAINTTDDTTVITKATIRRGVLFVKLSVISWFYPNKATLKTKVLSGGYAVSFALLAAVNG